MKVARVTSIFRTLFGEGPAYAFYYLFSCLFAAHVLRYKAAGCPYPHVQKILLSRSGLLIGRDVYLGYGCLVLSSIRKPVLILKDRVAVGPRVTFLTTSYPNFSVLRDHPDLTNSIHMLEPIVVEEDAWIGAGATIFPGVVIGKGAVVGAGAVVIGNVEDWTVVVGTPAQPLRTLEPIAGIPRKR